MCMQAGLDLLQVQMSQDAEALQEGAGLLTREPHAGSPCTWHTSKPADSLQVPCMSLSCTSENMSYQAAICCRCLPIPVPRFPPAV